MSLSTTSTHRLPCAPCTACTSSFRIAGSRKSPCRKVAHGTDACSGSLSSAKICAVGTVRRTACVQPPGAAPRSTITLRGRIKGCFLRISSSLYAERDTYSASRTRCRTNRSVGSLLGHGAGVGHLLVITHISTRTRSAQMHMRAETHLMLLA